MRSNWLQRSAVAIVMLLFIVRGLFYCVLQPIWEGYDEWAHFAYVQHIAQRASLPDRKDQVSPEVRRSLEIAPLPYAPDRPASGVTHDDFWRLPEQQRQARLRELHSCCSQQPTDVPTRFLQYEAQQPPLYYLLLTLPYVAAQGMSLPARVYLLRVISLAITSLVFPLAFAIARRVFDSERLAFAATLLIACLPGLYVDVCRVGNESLAIVLTAAVVLCALRVIDDDARPLDWLMLGCSLGAALLTKSYALAFIPIVPGLGILRYILYRESGRRIATGTLIALAATVSIGGWWYWHTWRVTGTLSGEMMDVAANSFGLNEKIAAVFRIQWLRVVDSIAFTYIWTSGWSFLGVRSWMYRVFEIIGALALLGLLILPVQVAAKKRHSKSWAKTVVIAYAPLLLCLAVAYQALAIYLAKGLTTGVGWYLYAGVASEVVLVGIGFATLLGARAARAILALTSALALALDLYSVNFLLAPYYTGMIAHDPITGHLSAFHIGSIAEIGQRLSLVNGLALTPVAICVLWAAYLCATAALLVLALQNSAASTVD
jgi:hypothetical protein